jgi:hypothetical protein
MRGDSDEVCVREAPSGTRVTACSIVDRRSLLREAVGEVEEHSLRPPPAKLGRKNASRGM